MAELTDREMLERAAKAAGIVVFPWPSEDPVRLNLMGGLEWNPLEDDGDALRLAVKLRMTIHRHDPAAVCAGWGVGTPGAPTSDGKGPWFWKEWLRDQPDDAEATRRAIVRAAAASLHQPEGGKTEC